MDNEAKTHARDLKVQGVHKKKTWYTRSFYLDKVPPSPHLLKKEINNAKKGSK